MSLGSIWLRLRQTYGDGWQVHRYRDRLRHRILETAPVAGIGDDATAEVHVLTRADDWLNLVWTLKSFYGVTGRRYPLCVHDDGTMTAEAEAQLRRHFPGLRYLSAAESDATMPAALNGHPAAAAFRAQFKLARKVLDFRHYLESERMLLVDSDVLFFTPPRVLLERVEDPAYRKNSLNADISTAYTVSREIVERELAVPFVERINSGLGLIHRDSFEFDRIEQLLGVTDVLGHYWRIEQTLFALCSMVHGFEMLPAEYDVYRGAGLGDRPSRHYVGEVRKLMYAEGMARLLRDGTIKLA